MVSFRGISNRSKGLLRISAICAWPGSIPSFLFLVLAACSNPIAAGPGEISNRATEIQALIEHPETKSLSRSMEHVSLSRSRLQEFCETDVSVQKGRIFLRKRGGKEGEPFNLYYSEIEPKTVPDLIGLLPGSELYRTESTARVWDEWDEKGMPGICNENRFSLIVYSDGEVLELQISRRLPMNLDWFEGKRSASEDIQFLVHWRKLKPPWHKRFRKYATISKRLALTPQQYGSLCRENRPESIEVGLITERENVVGIRLKQVPQSTDFYGLGLRNGDILRDLISLEVKGSALQPDTDSVPIPELCTQKESTFLVERGGRLYRATWKVVENLADSGFNERQSDDVVSVRLLMKPLYEDVPELLDPVSPGNPINPQTEEPYTDHQMQRFEELREKFPDNSVIPARQDSKTRAKREEERKRIYRIQTRIVKKEATCKEVNEYYDYQSNSIRDRIELIEYVLEKREAEPEMLKKFQEVLEMNKRTLKSYEKAKARALKNCLSP